MTPSIRSTLHPLIRLHIVVAIWGLTGPLVALIQLPATQVVTIRCVIAAFACFLLLALKHDSLKVTGVFNHPGGLDYRVRLQWIGIGAILGIHWILLFVAVNVSNVSVAMVGLATTPLWTALTDPLIQRKPFVPLQFVLGAVVVFGILLIFGDGAAVVGYGFSLAILSAILATVFSSLNTFYTFRFAPLQLTAWQLGAAAVVAAVSMPLTSWMGEVEKTLSWPSGQDWVLLILLALVCTVYAYSEFVDLLKKLSVYTILLTNNLEPIYGIAIGALFFGDAEELSWRFYAGAAVIIAAVGAEAITQKASDS
ncbi:MAG: DMT family transporter [Planctomycetota bacterium]